MCSRQPRELPTNDLHEALLEHVEQEIDSLRDSVEEKIADLESRLDDIDYSGRHQRV
jgi:hypothetical protein